MANGHITKDTLGDSYKKRDCKTTISFNYKFICAISYSVGYVYNSSSNFY